MNTDIKNYGRVAAFVDGYNLYETVRQHRFENLQHRARWYRLDKIIACCLAADDEALTALIDSGNLFINFYTAPPYEKGERKDERYNPAHYAQWINLQKNLGVYVVESYFQPNKNFFQEKLTDIRLAVDMVCGAYEDAFDTAVVVSRDRDFNPAARAVQNPGAGCKRAIMVRVGEVTEKSTPDIYNLSFDDFTRHCLEADEVHFENATQASIAIIPELQIEFDETAMPFLPKQRTAKRLEKMPRP